MQQLNVVEAMHNILVVDDDSSVCRSVQKVLRRKGYETAQAQSVTAALDILENGERYDLIIADLMMPQAGGIELLKIVKERWPTTPLLIITGYASITSAVEATRHGASGYLPKPFTLEELAEAVDNVLAAEAPQTDGDEQATLAVSEAIDVDMPFDRREVAKATSAQYVEQLTRSDMPIVTPANAMTAAPDYCHRGERRCKRVVKQGVCKQPECPVLAGERKKAAKAGRVIPIVPDPIDVDMPFSRSEVLAMTSQAYVDALGPSGMPNLGYWRSEKKVLVVDDEPVVVNSIRKTLVRRAYRIEEAFTGAEAMRRILAEPYDLVFLDMRLPDADGLELVSNIKRHKPSLRVVIVTGYASIDTAVEAIKRGASDYMSKPFTPEELTSMAGRVMGRAA